MSSPRVEAPQSARASGSSMRLAGSARRVNFGSTGSARRDSSGPPQHYGGSSSRKMMMQQTGSPLAAGGGTGGGGGGGLSLEQQSATHSAVSMNSIFSEARREIRRALARDSAVREKAEYQRMADGEHTPGTPAHAQAAGAEHDVEAQQAPAELDWHSDLSAMRDMLRSNYVLASLLLCIPLGIITHFTRIGGVSATFVTNFLAIIPLAWLLGNATEELALRSNETIGGLLNATFGNAVELIVSIVALNKGMIKLVQTSLLGSILSNCLLVLGMAFMLGGMKHRVQFYNHKGAHMLSSLLLLASIALVLPAAFVNSFQPHPSMAHLLQISRITALILFIIYLLYLFFQLFTHAEMFEDESEEEEEEGGEEAQWPADGPSYAAAVKQGLKSGPPKKSAMSPSPKQHVLHNHHESRPKPVDVAAGYQASSAAADDEEEEEIEPVQAVSDHMKELSDLEATPASMRNSNSNSSLPHSIAEDEESGASGSGSRGAAGDTATDDLYNTDDEADECDDGSDDPHLTLWGSVLLLVLVTLTVAACCEFLVGSIEEVTTDWGMNVSFVGVILLPIVGNAAEHATAITVAMKNKMDLSIGVAIGSSTQIALFLIPFVTLLGWIIDQPMSLNFSSFETISFLVAVLMVTTLLKNGESNWLQGVMLMSVYLIIATAFWYVPERSTDPRFQNHHTSWMPVEDTAEASRT